MNKSNKVLLEELINKRLQESLDDENENSEAFEEAMEAIDRSMKLESAKRDRLVKCIEIGALVVAAPLIDAGCKKAFAKMICNFEVDNVFTSTAGKSLSSLFKFKK